MITILPSDEKEKENQIQTFEHLPVQKHTRMHLQTYLSIVQITVF